MAYTPAIRLHDFSAQEQQSIGGTYQRPLPSNTYFLPYTPLRMSSGDASYRGGFRSQGMSAQSYLESIATGRGYRAPERMKGEYKDHEQSGSMLSVPSAPLSSFRGIGK